MAKRVRDWIDDRTGYRSVLHAILLLNFPVSRGARWRYVWGGSLAMMLVVELVTGTLLMTVYSPSETAAWGSVRYLETEVSWGRFIRGVHHYTSHMMLIVILLHTLLVILTAGYRKPKEFTYWTGLVLGGVVLALAISGNPLPWDQKGYWAYQIETGIAGTMPMIGSALRTLLVGGSEFGHLTLTRLYTLHVVVLPVLAVFLLVIHIALMRREKLLVSRLAGLPIVNETETTDNEGCRGTEPYWPYQTTRNLLMFTVLMGIVVSQLLLYPKMKERYVARESAEWEQDIPLGEITLQAPADPDIPYVARPEWYVRCLFELRHMVDKEQEVLITGVLPMVVVLLLFLMPFYEKVLGRRLGFWFCSVLFLAGWVGMVYLTFDGISQDRKNVAFQANRRREIDYAGRALWLASQNGIPPEGPRTLLHNDAKAMGPLLFAANCATCHRWNGHNGTGKVVTETVAGKTVPAIPTASDLFQFATTEWIAEFLADPTNNKFFGHMDRTSGGEDIKEGDMASWKEENLPPDGPLQKKHLRAVAAFIARQADRKNDPPVDAATLKLGLEIFSGAELKDDAGKELEFYGYCVQCHAMKAGDPNDEGGGAAPDFNGYGSRKWLIDFIRNPGEERFYGEKNIMPSFDATRISQRDIGLLVEWMRGEWAQANE